MFKGIFRKILFGLLIVPIFCIILFAGVSLYNQIKNTERMIISSNQKQIDVLSKAIEMGYMAREWPLKLLSKFSEDEAIVFWWVIDSKQNIYLADDVNFLGMKVKKKEVISFPKGREISNSLKNGQKIKLIKRALNIGLKDNPWNFFVGISLKPIQTAKRQTFVFVAILCLVILSLMSLTSYFLSKRIANPIKELTKGVEKIAKGNFKYRTRIKTGDELEELGEAINRMAKDLGESHAALGEAKTVLEIKVRARTRELRGLAERREEIIEQRTKEIKKRMEELEKFHRLAVGRELKMIELKKEIERLKKELERKR